MFCCGRSAREKKSDRVLRGGADGGGAGGEDGGTGSTGDGDDGGACDGDGGAGDSGGDAGGSDDGGDDANSGAGGSDDGDLYLDRRVFSLFSSFLALDMPKEDEKTRSR